MPDDDALPHLEKTSTFINSRIRRLKERILATEKWEPVGEAIRISGEETAIVYAHGKEAERLRQEALTLSAREPTR
jgi:hypothetical protein